MNYMLYIIFSLSLLLSMFSHDAGAFSPTGCGDDCKKCHSITQQEVEGVLKEINLSHGKIISIKLSPVKSLWEVSIDDKGKKGILYIDFSKKYILSGSILELATKSNKTAESLQNIPIGKTDISKIPLSNALALGNPSAAKKVVVFTDPD